MLCLVIDTETTGVDTTKDDVIEIAASLVDLTNRVVVASYSTLVYAEQNPAIEINHIPVEALRHDIFRTPDLEIIRTWAAAAEFCIAHQASFDQPLCDRLFQSQGVDLIDTPWICSLTQLKLWPPGMYPHGPLSKKLRHLAADWGISSVNAHRALADVQTLAELLFRFSEKELMEQIIDAIKPRKTYVAQVSYDNREQAKQHGFRWISEAKEWQKELAEDELPAIPFPVRPLVATEKKKQVQ